MCDINHKDKQNFEAVMRITHPTFIKVLQQIPDAQGTIEFLHVLRCIVDSYLDEKSHHYNVYTRLGMQSFFADVGANGLRRAKGSCFRIIS